MKIQTRRLIANTLRRTPWAMKAAYTLWRILQAKYTIGVVAVILDQQERVLLVEHVFHPKQPWGLPGGWIDRREAPEHAVTRELKEELALDATTLSILLMEFNYGNHLDVAILCEANSEIGTLSDELLDYGWFHLDSLPPIRQFHRRAIQKALTLRQSSYDNNT